MASRTELEGKPVDELRKMASDREVEGRSTMNKEELVNSLADDDSSSNDDEAKGAVERGDAVAVDENRAQELEDREVSPEEAKAASDERLSTVEEEAGPETAELTAHEMDESGPLHTQAPSERPMTGAVSEEQAKEQADVLKNMPDDFVGGVSEAGFNDDGSLVGSPESRESIGDPERDFRKDNLHESDDRELTEVRQEDVIDYPPPLQDDSGLKQQAPVDGPFANSSVVGSDTPAHAQKAVFYTDGLSGEAEHNLERAYVVPIHSQNDDIREAGKVSDSEARKEAEADAKQQKQDAQKASNE